jgi:hypothetical protein
VKCGVTVGVTVATLQPATVSAMAAANGVRRARLGGRAVLRVLLARRDVN